ncbi:MAG: peptidylprolyl isomerase, partial [Desulfuromonadaceae bacterium]
DGAVTISPEKVKNHYTVNIARYSKPEEFRASQILIKVDPSLNTEEKKALKAKAEDILKRIKAGEKFEEIAINESDDASRVKGGDLGYFHSGQTVPEFEEAILKLKVGEVSDVIETLYGFHIIRLTEKRAARLIPFDEIQDRIKKDLVDAEKKRLLENWMGKLYKNAKISYPGVK